MWLSVVLSAVGVCSSGARPANNPNRGIDGSIYVVSDISTKAQLVEEVMQDHAAWLVRFHSHSDEQGMPSQGADDEREMAWFAKLSVVWERRKTRKAKTGATLNPPLKFASVDATKVGSEVTSALLGSEFSFPLSGMRLIIGGKDSGVPEPPRMTSRKAMHIVLGWLDTRLTAKDEV